MLPNWTRFLMRKCWCSALISAFFVLVIFNFYVLRVAPFNGCYLTVSYVPIISLKFGGVSLDLLCARSNLPAIPRDFDAKNDDYLYNLDERCVSR